MHDMWRVICQDMPDMWRVICQDMADIWKSVWYVKGSMWRSVWYGKEYFLGKQAKYEMTEMCADKVRWGIFYFKPPTSYNMLKMLGDYLLYNVLVILDVLCLAWCMKPWSDWMFSVWHGIWIPGQTGCSLSDKVYETLARLDVLCQTLCIKP